MHKAYQIINGQIWEFSYFKLTPSFWVDMNNNYHKKRSKVFKTRVEAETEVKKKRGMYGEIIKKSIK